jgi:hypothetical protein
MKIKVINLLNGFVALLVIMFYNKTYHLITINSEKPDIIADVLTIAVLIAVFFLIISFIRLIFEEWDSLDWEIKLTKYQKYRILKIEEDLVVLQYKEHFFGAYEYHSEFKGENAIIDAMIKANQLKEKEKIKIIKIK